MTEAPEVIWAERLPEIFDDIGIWHSEKTEGHVAYIREDIVKAQIFEAVEAGVDRLINAMRLADEYIDKGLYERARNVTRATLKEQSYDSSKSQGCALLKAGDALQAEFPSESRRLLRLCREWRARQRELENTQKGDNRE